MNMNELSVRFQKCDVIVLYHTTHERLKERTPFTNCDLPCVVQTIRVIKYPMEYHSFHDHEIMETSLNLNVERSIFKSAPSFMKQNRHDI